MTRHISKALGAFITQARIKTNYRLTRAKIKQEGGDPEGVYLGRWPPCGCSRTSFCGQGRHKLTGLAGALSPSPGLFGGRPSQQIEMEDNAAVIERHTEGGRQ
jgi:hypothetical protein